VSGVEGTDATQKRRSLASLLAGVLVVGAVAVAQAQPAPRRPEPRMPGRILGPNDTRHPSKDPAVGRMPNPGCTAWLTQFGAVLTAGHCVTLGGQITLEFNVPLSSASGVINHPSNPNDIYKLRLADYEDGANDWAVFVADPTGGQTPVARQGAFVRIASTSNLAFLSQWPTARVTGYGVDGPPPKYGESGPLNQYNQTQQTATGPLQGSGSQANTICYGVDTQPGNSGGPVLLNGVEVAIAIHVSGPYGNCSPDVNYGTLLTVPGLIDALQNAPALGVAIPSNRIFFVDEGSPIAASAATGAVMNPFLSLKAGLNAAATGTPSIVAVAPGNYAELPYTLTLKTDVTLSMSGDVLFFPGLQ